MAKAKDKGGFDNNVQAIVDLSKQTQESLQKLPADARILGFGTGTVGLYGLLEVCIIFKPPEASIRSQIQSGANALLVFAGIITILYIVGRVVFHWMSLWEKLQLMRLQNEKARSEESSDK